MSEEMIREEERVVEERASEQSWVQQALLDRPIGELPDLRQPCCVAPETSCREAVDRMVAEKVGCVLVVRDGKVAGIFTERDVLCQVAGRPIDLDRTPVERLMTPDPECLTPGEAIAYALNRMVVGGFRHIPLVDADGRPVGLVAMRHIVECLVDLFPHSVLTLPPSPGRTISRRREGA